MLYDYTMYNKNTWYNICSVWFLDIRIYFKTLYNLYFICNIKTHSSESQGQEAACATTTVS